MADGSSSFSGFKVDVWACGVTLFLLTTGEAPFQGTSLINLFENIQKGLYRIPHAIESEEDLKDLIQRLLQVDQEQRICVSDALNHKWLAEGEHQWGQAQREMVQRTLRPSRSASML